MYFTIVKQKYTKLEYLNQLVFDLGFIAFAVFAIAIVLTTGSFLLINVIYVWNHGIRRMEWKVIFYTA